MAEAEIEYLKGNSLFQEKEIKELKKQVQNQGNKES